MGYGRSRRPMRWCRSVARRNHARAGKHARPAGRGNRRTAVIYRGQQCVIGARGLLVLGLQGRWRRVRRVGVCFLLRRRAGGDPAIAAVEAHMGGRVVDDRAVVDVGDAHVAEVVGGAVVGEPPMIPVAALVAHAAIAVAVIDAAVEADRRSPVALVEEVDPVVPAPPARRPEQTHRGRQHPGSGHPVIAVRSVRPIAGRPEIAGCRDRRLHVNGKLGWRERDVHADRHLPECRRRTSHGSQRQQDRHDEAVPGHV